MRLYRKMLRNNTRANSACAVSSLWQTASPAVFHSTSRDLPSHRLAAPARVLVPRTCVDGCPAEPKRSERSRAPGLSGVRASGRRAQCRAQSHGVECEIPHGPRPHVRRRITTCRARREDRDETARGARARGESIGVRQRDLAGAAAGAFSKIEHSNLTPATTWS
jgi:hypothetical protein